MTGVQTCALPISELVRETKAEIDHLESIATALDIAVLEEDLVQIKEELTDFGYIRKKRNEKRAKSKSKPFHYISSDGFHMYVGKNNFQNDELTFQFSSGSDWWFHGQHPGPHLGSAAGALGQLGQLYFVFHKSSGFFSVFFFFLKEKEEKRTLDVVDGLPVHRQGRDGAAGSLWKRL